MNLEGLPAQLSDRWTQTNAVESLFDAIERMDIAAVRAYRRDPVIVAAIDADRGILAEVVACMAVCGDSTLEAQAVTTIREQPDLARVPVGAGQTMLHRAAAGWNLAFCALLLEHGADPNAREVGGHTPLYRTANRFPRPTGAAVGLEHDLVALLVLNGARVDAADGVKRSTALHMAARRGNAQMATALIAHGADIEARDSNGETPLRRAVNCSQPSVARVLLAAGADPESQCHRGRTPRSAARTAEMRAILGQNGAVPPT